MWSDLGSSWCTRSLLLVVERLVTVHVKVTLYRKPQVYAHFSQINTEGATSYWHVFFFSPAQGVDPVSVVWIRNQMLLLLLEILISDGLNVNEYVLCIPVVTEMSFKQSLVVSAMNKRELYLNLISPSCSCPSLVNKRPYSVSWVVTGSCSSCSPTFTPPPWSLLSSSSHTSYRAPARRAASGRGWFLQHS